ncbi:MAG: tetratricopeptide repeat protein [Lishizhenia sp.]
MKKVGLFLFLVGAMIACTTPEKEVVENDVVIPVKTEEEFIEHLRNLDDSLKAVITESFQKQEKFPVGAYQKAIEQHLEFYKAYPKNKNVAESLDKAQSFYTQLRAEEKAAVWRDTIIFNFKEYVNRPRVLETQGVYYDADNYNPEKIKLYYTMLLDEYPDLDSNKRVEIQFRLDNVNLSFDELIELNTK